MPKAKRRQGVRQFALLPADLLTHRAVVSLDHGAFRVMVLVAGQYRGHNNGALGLTAGQARVAGIGSAHTFYSALRKLTERGLIECTYPASRIPPRPAMFALTWQAVDATKYTAATRTPTHAYRDWQP